MLWVSDWLFFTILSQDWRCSRASISKIYILYAFLLWKMSCFVIITDVCVHLICDFHILFPFFLLFRLGRRIVPSFLPSLRKWENILSLTKSERETEWIEGKCLLLLLFLVFFDNNMCKASTCMHIPAAITWNYIFISVISRTFSRFL